MKKLILLGLLISSPVYADIKHSITSSVKLEAIAAGTTADKIGSSYSITGNNITTVNSDSAATVGGLGTTTSGVPAITFPTASQATSGSAFSFSQSYTEGDATPNAVPSVGSVPNFSDITSTSAASVGTAAIGLSNHSITLTPGTGTGVTLTGQFVTDLTIE